MIQPGSVDASQRDLIRLLGRLEQKLLGQGDTERDIKVLSKSQYERNKVNANIEHARALLFRLEHDSPSSCGTTTSSKQQTQRTSLQEQRALIKRLQKRLDELAHTQDSSPSSDSDSDLSDDEDHLINYAPAITDIHGGLDTKIQDKPAIGPSDAQKAAAAATVSSTLRSRKGGDNLLQQDRGATSGSTRAGSSATKLGNTTTPFNPAPDRTTTTDSKDTTKLIEAHDSEQTQLTEGLLTLASALKQSTLSFADSLDSSNPILDTAARALDKNVTGMEAAGKRMGALRRMTEGKGWWARFGLYGWVGALWVVAILIGLVLPKLRF